MQLEINNFNKCCKPKRRDLGFEGKNSNPSQTTKVRYKHYEEMSDDVLELRSILKAHNDVENSSKMSIFKAIPSITAGLLGLCIGLAQPGKLSNKVAQGLGFLALLKSSDVIYNMIDKKVDKKSSPDDSNKRLKKAGLYFVAMGALVAGVLNVKKLKNVEFLKPVMDFAKKESKTLAKEINETKVGNFFKNTVKPFADKHKDLTLTASFLAPFGIMAGSTFGTIKMSESLSKDIKEKAEQNYTQGKLIQKIAREHFDSIDAIEV